MLGTRKRNRAAYRIGDVVAHRDYPKKCGRVMKVETTLITEESLYTVRWSDHPNGSSQHFGNALKAVIKKL